MYCSHVTEAYAYDIQIDKYELTFRRARYLHL
jgi:hypothetical protein